MDNDDIKMIALTKTILPQTPEDMLEKITNFKELMIVYNSAIREVTTKLEILNDELSVTRSNGPIQFIKSRVKKPTSIVDKLQRLEKEMNVNSVKNSLNDVAGIRVITSFIDEVYEIADMLIKQDDIVLIQVKDYIKNPKPNGYSSYHMVIEVPVFFSSHSLHFFVKIPSPHIFCLSIASLIYSSSFPLRT